MFEYRLGIKLQSTTANTAALKLLRKHFPNTSLAELRHKIQAHDYVYFSDLLQHNKEREAIKMLWEFDQTGIEVELFEASRDTPGPWKTAPLSREVLYNMLHRSREIERQVLEDIERETAGHIDSETSRLIDEHMLEEEKIDQSLISAERLPLSSADRHKC